MTSQVTSRREEGSTSYCSRSQKLHLERARNREGGSKWCQNGQFIVVNDLKNAENAENAVFYLTVLNKIYSRDVF
jgi:hypothetical protein